MTDREHSTAFTADVPPRAERSQSPQPSASRMAAPAANRRIESMRIVRAKQFRAERAWGALDIAEMNGITVRLHWTDQPYRWHVNDGAEVFAVLDGTVEMHVRQDGHEVNRPGF